MIDDTINLSFPVFTGAKYIYCLNIDNALNLFNQGAIYKNG